MVTGHKKGRMAAIAKKNHGRVSPTFNRLDGMLKDISDPTS